MSDCDACGGMFAPNGDCFGFPYFGHDADDPFIRTCTADGCDFTYHQVLRKRDLTGYDHWAAEHKCAHHDTKELSA